MSDGLDLAAWKGKAVIPAVKQGAISEDLPPIIAGLRGAGPAPGSVELPVNSSQHAAPTDLAGMMESDLPATLAGLQPQLRYLLLDEGRIADHPDPSLRNLASALFRLEFSLAPEEFRTAWDRLFDWISHPNQESLRRAFIAWANRIGLRRQLQHRFGADLPKWLDERLERADTDQLEAWGEELQEMFKKMGLTNPTNR